MAGFSTEIEEIRGAEVEVVSVGQGDPLLYLHGFLAEGSGSAALGNLADAGYEVIRPSLPGFGSSTGMEAIDVMEDLVFWLLDFMDHRGLERAPIASVCLGAWLGAEMAIRHPERIERLVLTDPPGIEVRGQSVGDLFGVDFPDLAEILFHDQTLPFVQLLKVFDAETAKKAKPNPEAVIPFLRSLAAAARLAWNPYFVDPKLEGRLFRAEVPTLVVWGSEDRLIPGAAGQIYADGMPDARLVTIPECGHLPPLERPDDWSKIVLDFLAT